MDEDENRKKTEKEKTERERGDEKRRKQDVMLFSGDHEVSEKRVDERTE